MQLAEKIKSLNLISYLLFLLIVIQVAYCLWACDRGFDFTDEAYGYLGFINPGEVQKAHTYYAYIFEKFFGWGGISVVKVRVIRLVLIILCGLVFSFGLVTWLRRHTTFSRHHQVNFILFFLCGCLLINANGSQSFTYNICTALLLQLACGTVMHSLDGSQQFAKKEGVIFFLTGILLFLLFAVKFSGAIALTVTIAILVFADRKNVKIWGLCMISIFTGSVLAGLGLFGTRLSSWLVEYRYSLTLLADMRSQSILSRYLEDVSYIWSVVIANFVLLITSIVLMLTHQHFHSKRISWLSAAFFGVVLIVLAYTRDYYLGGVKYFYTFTSLYILVIFIALVTICISLIVDFIRKADLKWQPLKIVLFLLLLPLFGSVGTTNLLSIQIIWYSSFLFGAVYVMFYVISSRLLGVVVLILAVNAAIQCVSGLIYFPYRTLPLHEETNELSVNGETLKVNYELKNSIETAVGLIQSKTNFSKGDPVFALSSDLGFVYFLKGNLPGWAYYQEQSTPWTTFKLQNTVETNLQKTIMILPTDYKMDSVYQICLKNLNVNFPKNYTRLGDVSYSIEGYNRPLSIYAPNDFLKRKFE